VKLRNAFIGAGVWIVAVLALRLPIIDALFLWAPLVIMPLGLDLIPVPRAFRIAQPLAALLAAASFAFPPGATAAGLAIPWAVLCGALAILGAARFFRRRPFDFVETLVDAALGLIAVGGYGLVMSRAGMKPGGFEEPIVLLTAVHFHYTGFAAPLLVGLAGRRVGPRLPILVAGAAVVIATPVLAAGFTLHLPLLKVIAAFAIAAGLAVFSWQLVRLSVDEPRTLPRVPLGVAAFSIFWGMVFVGLYSVGEFRERIIVAIPQMAWIHGIVNAFGFATCGLLAARKWS